MNDHHQDDCLRFDAMMASWFDDDGLSAPDRQALTAHLAGCASCRESFELVTRMESALMSRAAGIPAAGAFLPEWQTARPSMAHPKLIAAFRAMMSPAGIAIILVMWSTMLAFHFRETLAGALAWSSSERFSMLLGDVSNTLLGIAGGDAYTLAAIYIVLALVVLGSTGAITLRYIRHS